MKMVLSAFTLLVHIALLSRLCFGGDPTVYTELRVSYTTVSPLGVPQQVIAIDGKFPGPLINVTTNNHVIVNVYNGLDEELLMTWPGVQMRRNSWQDGVLGTNCPIPSKWNWTYQFQVKDQIGSFFYFPSLNFQRASGGFGPFVINNREVIPIPFAQPDGDIFIIIGDWYTQNHTALRATLDGGKDLGIPDGVLINGKGPFQYNTTLVPSGIDYEKITVDPGKTYRIRVHNVGISTSLNFRIQNHNLLLVETEGHYTTQSNFTNFDIHAGQSYSFLLSTDQNASTDYYIVASARFVNESLWQKVTGVAILHYSNSKGPASGPLPPPPDDFYDKTASMNQARSVRQNTSASGARPNPQGSFRYGSINITDTYVLKVTSLVPINGTNRAAINGISFLKPDLPFRLADKNDLRGIYKLDFPSKPMNRTPKIDRSIINATYKGFIEVILQNNDSSIQNFHLDGYSFFVVGMDYGDWTDNSRGSYNKWDAISRCTTQVFPGGWTAILISLDNVGSWNLRAENLDRWYLGQETYLRIINPEENGDTEMAAPDNVLYCGALKYKQKSNSKFSAASTLGHSLNLFTVLLGIFSAVIFLIQAS
ncbi:monocopper oxidase-like protein SKS1 [Vigna radiata var. radiata]|uniref:Monocopper oxidase-like protein SKS1 n=1 Tax=Vigna radiata var. radiata TaxID=3916 RepID=A0A1S3U178_VIGRR|nr:monocopper oxidase-like protein SKS1 [Vigna radiata var. radiata]